ncbi:MAG: hypothetical protein JSS24_02595 [Proteobacteria bacterium]|nr:hypothetical protein [Pseudomonadota bacterium]
MWVPDVAHEALRDLVRAREAARQDQLRARHRLGRFLRLWRLPLKILWVACSWLALFITGNGAWLGLNRRRSKVAAVSAEVAT